MIKNFLNNKSYGLVSPLFKQQANKYSNFKSFTRFYSSNTTSSNNNTSTTPTSTSSIFENYGLKKKSPMYHRGSTQYTNTTREQLIKLEKEFTTAPKFQPITISDKIARGSVWFLRRLSNLFFKEKYIHYAVVLETIAGIPGLCGSMLLHLRVLRTMEANNWIKVLMDESENERMHLMTFVAISKPTLVERAMVAVAQAIYWNIFLVFYIMSAKTAHRFTGYLEEEAVHTYNNFLKDIDLGKVKNVPAPQIAIEYWGLPNDATLRDCVLVIRQDENDHRSVNHEISNKISKNDNSPVEF